jgi:ribosomal subunit interface protein
MNIAVRIRTSRVSDGLRAYVQRRLQFSLARFADRLAHVSVRIAHTEGASGERLYVCRVEAEVRPSGGPMVEEVADRDLYTAIDLAADRAGRALRRTLAWGREVAGHDDGRLGYDRRVPKSAEEAVPHVEEAVPHEIDGRHVVQEDGR